MAEPSAEQTDLALSPLQEFVQRRGGEFRSFQTGDVHSTALFPRALTEGEIEELFKLSAARSAPRGYPKEITWARRLWFRRA